MRPRPKRPRRARRRVHLDGPLPTSTAAGNAFADDDSGCLHLSRCTHICVVFWDACRLHTHALGRLLHQSPVPGERHWLSTWFPTSRSTQVFKPTSGERSAALLRSETLQRPTHVRNSAGHDIDVLCRSRFRLIPYLCTGHLTI